MLTIPASTRFALRLGTAAALAIVLLWVNASADAAPAPGCEHLTRNTGHRGWSVAKLSCVSASAARVAPVGAYLDDTVTTRALKVRWTARCNAGDHDACRSLLTLVIEESED